MEQFEQLLTCAICLDRYRNPKLLPCQHSFCMEPCMDGLVDYVRRQVKCPECRAEHRIPYQVRYSIRIFPFFQFLHCIKKKKKFVERRRAVSSQNREKRKKKETKKKDVFKFTKGKKISDDLWNNKKCIKLNINEKISNPIRVASSLFNDLHAIPR